MFKGPLASCEINPSFQKHLLLLIRYYDIKYHYLSSLYINLKTIPVGINFRVKLGELNDTRDNLRAQCTKRSGCGSLFFLCPTTLPLSHFFGWINGYLCASSENWSSSKSKQLTNRNSKKSLPAYSYSLPASALALTGFCVSHINLPPLNFIFHEVTFQVNQFSNTANSTGV